MSSEPFWLFALGLGTGVLSGYLGIGGALIIIPVLLELFAARGIPEEMRMHLVVGTSMLAILGAVTSSTIAHARASRVYWKAVPFTAVTAILMSLVGSRLSALSSAAFLKGFFVLFALGSATMLLIKPPAPDRGISLHRNRLLAIGLLAGAVSAYIGVAGGIVMVPLFILWAGVPTEMAAGTSTAVGIVTAIVGTAGHILNGLGVPDRPEGAWGFVLPAVALPILFGTIFGGPLGSKLNRSLGRKVFRYVFAVFLLVIAAKVWFW